MILLVIPLLIWLWKRTKLQWSWNPFSWWNDATNLAGGAIDQLHQWVLSVVQSAINLVENDVNDVLHFADWLYQQATNATDWFVTILGQRIDGVLGWAQHAIGDAVNWASYLYNRAVGLATYLYNTAVYVAQRALSDAAGFLLATIRFVEREARLWVDDVIRWVNAGLNAVDRLAHALVDDAINWAEQAIAAAWRSVYGAVKHDLIAPIWGYLQWIIKAWDWVVWFAEHPFKVVHDAENDVIGWADHLPDDLAHIVKGREFVAGLEAMGKYLGG